MAGGGRTAPSRYRCLVPLPGRRAVRSGPRWSRRIRIRIAHGIVTAKRGCSWNLLATGPLSEISVFRTELHTLAAAEAWRSGVLLHDRQADQPIEPSLHRMNVDDHRLQRHLQCPLFPVSCQHASHFRVRPPAVAQPAPAGTGCCYRGTRRSKFATWARSLLRPSSTAPDCRTGGSHTGRQGTASESAPSGQGIGSSAANRRSTFSVIRDTSLS